LYETKDEVIVAADLPGVTEKDIHLSITGDVLTIQGERRWTGEDGGASYYRQERWFGKFERALSLPIPVEAGRVKAIFRDGVLTVKLPKSEGVKPREIKIDTL
jgi:HSP20 family protein